MGGPDEAADELGKDNRHSSESLSGASQRALLGIDDTEQTVFESEVGVADV